MLQPSGTIADKKYAIYFENNRMGFGHHGTFYQNGLIIEQQVHATYSSNHHPSKITDLNPYLAFDQPQGKIMHQHE